MNQNQNYLSPEEFWDGKSNLIDWFEKYETTLETWQGEMPQWFVDGQLNICHLAIDRHVLNGHGERIAFYFDSPLTQRKTSYTYSQVQDEVAKLAGGLKDLGVEKGDRVIIYMPMIPHTFFSMLACARIGAVHANVHGGFAPSEIAMRIDDSKAKIIITATSSIEENRLIAYKPIVDKAIELSQHKPEKVVVFQRRLGAILTKTHRFVDYQSLVENSKPAQCEILNSNHPLYILYTPGASGKPKGIVRDHGSYALGLSHAFKEHYKIESGKCIWAASDIAWLPGHSFGLYGALINGNSSVIFEGKPIGTPDSSSYWRIIDEYKVRHLFALNNAFEAIRMQDADGRLAKEYNLKGLENITLTGELVNPDNIKWLKNILPASIRNEYLQTETGISIASNSLNDVTDWENINSFSKLNSGFNAKIFDQSGAECQVGQVGYLAFKLPLPPAAFTSIYQDDERLKNGYLNQFEGYYFSGDRASIDNLGRIYLKGRADQVINVSGHRIACHEIENIIAQDANVAECVVIGVKDRLKGELPLAFVSLKDSSFVDQSEFEYKAAAMVRDQLGPIASFKNTVVLSRLAKTKSGKLLRSTLKNICDDGQYDFGAISDDFDILEELKSALKQKKLGSYNDYQGQIKEGLSEIQINTYLEYYKSYQDSVNDPEKFWSRVASTFVWKKNWDKTLEFDFSIPKVEWFKGGKLNITENCLDRHLESKSNDTAIIWEPNNSDDANRIISYKELHSMVSRFANVLKNNGVQKGDRVCIYMPMVPELAVATLACARIGAVHSVVFAGFSSTALSTRINDADCKIVLTSDGVNRGPKPVFLKGIVDQALLDCPGVKTSIVYKHTGQEVEMLEGRDIWWHDELKKVDDHCPATEMDSEDMLFILYTSGSTGKPKGMVHTCGGYMVQSAYTFKNVFNYKDGDVYFCTADIGWITGHSYIVYGPLANGATTLMFEGVPSYPDFGRFWHIVEKYKVKQFYTAPTAIRTLASQPVSLIEKHDISSLKVLGTVGEPINEEAWHWYDEKIGKQKCPIVDTWWQTETGAIMISPIANVSPTKPTFATKPLPGVQMVLMDENGVEINGNPAEGRLAIKFPWPSMARSIYGDHNRFRETYFSTYKNMYFTGDGAFRDLEGNYRITGRVDDVIIVSGHNLGTAPIENVINEHNNVVESAIVGYPHDIKGNALYAYVILYEDKGEHDKLRREINDLIARTIGPIAKLDKIQFVVGLPKTRSGKIMRRILRKIACNDTSNMGDISTLLNPDVVESIMMGSLSK